MTTLPGSDPTPTDDRCPYVATDPITTRYPRADDWRCGHDSGHSQTHTLYSGDGERELYAGSWILPAERAADARLVADVAERFAEALHRAMWGINAIEGMGPLGVHQHTTDPVEHAAQREFIRHCLRYVETTTGIAAVLAESEQARTDEDAEMSWMEQETLRRIERARAEGVTSEQARTDAEVSHWKSHAEEAGRGFARVCRDYARVSAQVHEATTRAESAEARTEVAVREAAERAWAEGWESGFSDLAALDIDHPAPPSHGNPYRDSQRPESS
ncbi:hypothetical protein [Nocardioides sp. InS609-2]|uniref:hypothetical protein n=1 Tax=Nocardioides sp. InS609-2 TaxID=2760705 RepID=UPI0020BD7C8D|nr:hypothetical protein [Nocardioides sp. InS609-2]